MSLLTVYDIIQVDRLENVIDTKFEYLLSSLGILYKSRCRSRFENDLVTLVYQTTL